MPCGGCCLSSVRERASFGIDVAANWPLAAALRLVPVAFVLLAVVQTVTGWRGDLVEGRRRLRLFILAAVVLHTAVSAGVDISIGPDHVPPAVHLLNAAALSLIAAVIAVALLHADLVGFLADSGQPAAVAIREDVPAAEPVDPALLGELERLMTVERLYRREGLTIGDLAAKLGLPEHRLRRTINRGLGFRNFSEYLNRHRLADAKQALADPAQRDVPILTIALDAGFQSLSPFNRAFKADTGMTPTEFRRRARGPEAIDAGRFRNRQSLSSRSRLIFESAAMSRPTSRQAPLATKEGKPMIELLQKHASALPGIWAMDTARYLVAAGWSRFCCACSRRPS